MFSSLGERIDHFWDSGFFPWERFPEAEALVEGMDVFWDLGEARLLLPAGLCWGEQPSGRWAAEVGPTAAPRLWAHVGSGASANSGKVAR